MGLHSRRVWIHLLLLSGATGAVLAMAPTQQIPQPPVFGTGVTLVAVPVYVTDKSGKSVAGLTREDFELEDGGKKVPIVGFQAIDVDTPATPESHAQVAELPVAMQAAAPRQFLLLLDLEFSPYQGITKARKAATAFMQETLAPGDLVSIATSGSGGMKVLTNFTSDHAYAVRALSGVGRGDSLGADPLGIASGFPGKGGYGGGGAEADEGLSASGGGDSKFGDALAEVDDAMKEARHIQYREHVTGFIQDLSKLVARLSQLRGRKQIVLLSAGYAEWAWLTPTSMMLPENKGQGSPLQDGMERIYREAGQADVVIHTISLAGIADTFDRRPNTPGAMPEGALNRDSGRGTLMAFAENTGGRFIMPTNNFGDAFGQVDQISRHSYVLAFETGETTSSKPRKLKVRVRGAGLSVSHRPSYTLAVPSKITDSNTLRLEAAESISKGLTSGPLRVQLTTLPYRDPAGQTSVHAALQIDGPALAGVATGDALAVQVYGYSMREGHILDSIALNTSMDLKKFGDAVRTSGIRVLTAFPVSPGAADLRFFVRTGGSGVTGSIQRSVVVPTLAEGANESNVSSPIFTLPTTGRVVVPFQSKDRPWIKVPFSLEGVPFVPDGSVTLTHGVTREACVYVWPARRGSIPPLEVTGELLQMGQAALPVRLKGTPRILAEPDGFDRYVVHVETPDAPPGAYTLRLLFRDPATGLKTRSETAVTVER